MLGRVCLSTGCEKQGAQSGDRALLDSCHRPLSPQELLLVPECSTRLATSRSSTTGVDVRNIPSVDIRKGQDELLRPPNRFGSDSDTGGQVLPVRGRRDELFVSSEAGT